VFLTIAEPIEMNLLRRTFKRHLRNLLAGLSVILPPDVMLESAQLSEYIRDLSVDSASIRRPYFWK